MRNTLKENICACYKEVSLYQVMNNEFNILFSNGSSCL